MVKKVLSIKANPEDEGWFKDLAKGFNTQAEAFNALRQVYEGKVIYQSEVFLDKEVYQSVCYAIGTKLPDAWELKTHKQEKKDRIWYVFPDEQVVAIRKKSPNGSQSWLEVAAIYPDEVWEAAKASRRFEYNPITTLIEEDRSYKEEQTKRNHPIVNEALSKGWEFDHWWRRLEEIVNEAKDYLQTVNLPEKVNQPEVLSIDKVYQKCVCDSQEPTTLTKAELTNTVSQPQETEVTLGDEEVTLDDDDKAAIAVAAPLVTHETVDLATDTQPDSATEPLRLNRDEMRSRYGLDNDKYSGLAGKAKKGKVKLDDGTYWSVDGKREKAVWTQESAIATADV